jgi:hypothetical protein
MNPTDLYTKSAALESAFTPRTGPVTYSLELKDLAVALNKVQATIKPAPKDSTNPAFRSKYADLAAVWEACRPALAANGLSVVQMPTAEGGKVSVTTLLLHTSGQWIKSELTMTAGDTKPQTIGSCITYARRYALSAMVGVVADDDDDANAASGTPTSSAPGSKPAAPKASPFAGAKL